VKQVSALLVNPFIYDYAAYNFWSSPIGLLYVGAILRANGFSVSLIDCLRSREEKRKTDGRAPFLKETVRPPEQLKGIRKRYRRYGISAEALRAELSSRPSPDLILVTSVMTYWYPGTAEVIETLRLAYPQALIVLGGIYPALCSEHALANMKGADLILSGTALDQFFRFVSERLAVDLLHRISPYDFKYVPYPCYDLYESIPFVPLLFSYGCPFHCLYCATSYLHPTLIRREPASLINELLYWRDRGVKRFVLYDDSFLYHADLYAKPFLRALDRLDLGLEFYNPNALNAALLDHELAHLLAAVGFREVRLGLETVDPQLQRSTGDKVTSRAIETAVSALFSAGFQKDAIKAYVLAGLPLQPWQTVQHALDYCFRIGISPYIAEYTPIPHTPLFERFHHVARYPIATDPIYQNNALQPFAWQEFTEHNMLSLKEYARKPLA
jgi:radical SAM superfamily enzyme YgiQ (UPF0313 family)